MKIGVKYVNTPLPAVFGEADYFFSKLDLGFENGADL